MRRGQHYHSEIRYFFPKQSVVPLVDYGLQQHSFFFQSSRLRTRVPDCRIFLIFNVVELLKQVYVRQALYCSFIFLCDFKKQTILVY